MIKEKLQLPKKILDLKMYNVSNYLIFKLGKAPSLLYLITFDFFLFKAENEIFLLTTTIKKSFYQLNLINNGKKATF